MCNQRQRPARFKIGNITCIRGRWSRSSLASLRLQSELISLLLSSLECHLVPQRCTYVPTCVQHWLLMAWLGKALAEAEKRLEQKWLGSPDKTAFSDLFWASVSDVIIFVGCIYVYGDSCRYGHAYPLCHWRWHRPSVCGGVSSLLFPSIITVISERWKKKNAKLKIASLSSRGWRMEGLLHQSQRPHHGVMLQRLLRLFSPHSKWSSLPTVASIKMSLKNLSLNWASCNDGQKSITDALISLVVLSKKQPSGL